MKQRMESYTPDTPAASFDEIRKKMETTMMVETTTMAVITMVAVEEMKHQNYKVFMSLKMDTVHI